MRSVRSFTATAAILTALWAAAPASAGALPSSNGHGGITVVTPDGKMQKRQFSFSAHTQKDGTVRGVAVLKNPQFDFFANFDVTCLRVVGNRATFGATVKKTNDPFFGPGGFNRGFFTVVDNGEPGSADTISSVFFDNVVGPEACEATGAEDFPQRPIENGNVQVKN